jgi:6-phosphofructokinase 1
MEIMGHNAGWLALGAGIAGGADVILIPEIAYDASKVAEAILSRSRGGKHFSIIAVSEGATSKEDAGRHPVKEMDEDGEAFREDSDALSADIAAFTGGHTLRLARQLEELTGLESRVTILGHLQRGGTPSSADRLLATRLGTACAALVDRGVDGVMVAARGEDTAAVPLEDVAGKRKTVPLDHPWIASARAVGTSLGD